MNEWVSEHAWKKDEGKTNLYSKWCRLGSHENCFIAARCFIAHRSRIAHYPSFISQDFFYFSSFIHNGDNYNTYLGKILISQGNFTKFQILYMQKKILELLYFPCSIASILWKLMKNLLWNCKFLWIWSSKLFWIRL